MQQNELIESILSIEHQARAMTDVADQVDKTFESSLLAEKQALRDKLQKESDDALRNRIAAEKASYEQRMAAIASQRSAKLDSMEKLYQQRKEEWIDALFRRVIGDRQVK